MKNVLVWFIRFAVVEMVFITVVNVINLVGYDMGEWYWPSAKEAFLWYPIMLIVTFAAMKMTSAIPAIMKKITKKQKYNLLVKGGNIL